MILSYLEKYPNAKVKTISPFGDMLTQNDHRALGEAALELYEEGKIKDLRFYVEPYKYEEFIQDKPDVRSWRTQYPYNQRTLFLLGRIHDILSETSMYHLH